MSAPTAPSAPQSSAVLFMVSEKLSETQKELRGIRQTIQAQTALMERLLTRLDNRLPATSSSGTVMQSPSIYTWAGVPTNTNASFIRVQSALARTNDFLRVPTSTSASSWGPEKSTSASTSLLSASPSDTSSSVSEDCKNEAVLENIPPESKNCLTSSASVSAGVSASVSAPGSAGVSASVSAPASADASASMSADGFACAPVSVYTSASASAPGSAGAPVPDGASASTSISTSSTSVSTSASTSISATVPLPSPTSTPATASAPTSASFPPECPSELFLFTMKDNYKKTALERTIQGPGNPLLPHILKSAPSTSASPQGRIRLKELFYSHSYGWDTG